MMAPFVGTGMGALQQLYGYSQVPSGYGGSAGGNAGGNAFTVPTLQYEGSGWDAPGTVGEISYAKTGEAFDPTGGSGRFMDQLEGLKELEGPNPNLQYQEYDPGQYIGRLNAFDADFKFNENDPAYQYQKMISERDINRQAAARGLHGSRAAINQLDESGRAITAHEYDKQYGRGRQNILDLYGMAGAEDTRSYGKAVDLYGREWSSLMDQRMEQRSRLADLYNMALKQGNVGYNALLDAVKIGTGSGATAGGLGNQAAALTGNAFNGMSQGAWANAANQQQAMGGVAGSALGGINNYLLYRSLMGNQGMSTAPGGGLYDAYGH
jgi:hypothetical protein